MSRDSRIRALAKMMWSTEAEKKANRKVGYCQFCGDKLRRTHRVIKDGQTIDCTHDSKSSIKAQGMLDEGKFSLNVLIFPVSSCEVMCDVGEYEAAEGLVDQWRNQWVEDETEKKKQAQVRAKQAELSSLPENSF